MDVIHAHTYGMRCPVTGCLWPLPESEMQIREVPIGATPFGRPVDVLNLILDEMSRIDAFGMHDTVLRQDVFNAIRAVADNAGVDLDGPLNERVNRVIGTAFRNVYERINLMVTTDQDAIADCLGAVRTEAHGWGVTL